MDWAKILEENTETLAKKPEGKDWFSATEFCEKSGWGKSRAYPFIKKKIESGDLEVFKGNEYSKAHNQLVRRIWYRFKNRK